MCSDCGGSRKITVICPMCDGQGSRRGNYIPCHWCGGSGELSEHCGCSGGYDDDEESDWEAAADAGW